MKNVTTWKTRTIKQGLSRYILVPKKMMEFEGIDDNDVVQVTIGKVQPSDESD